MSLFIRTPIWSNCSDVDLGRSIPTDLYKAVAEILAYVYTINQTSLKR